MLIRQADSAEERAEVWALWHEYLTWVNAEMGTRYDVSVPVEEMLGQRLAALSAFAPPHGSLLLAQDLEGVVGGVCLRPIGPAVGEVKRLYVRPRARGTGIGRQLLVRLLNDARHAGYRLVRLDSARFMHAAHSLYRSAGFVDREPYKESEFPARFSRYALFMEPDLWPSARCAGGQSIPTTEQHGGRAALADPLTASQPLTDRQSVIDMGKASHHAQLV